MHCSQPVSASSASSSLSAVCSESPSASTSSSSPPSTSSLAVSSPSSVPQTPQSLSAEGAQASTSTALVLLHKSDCDPSFACSSSEPQASSSKVDLPEDPRPGPSTSAAEFDLEVFDSGSSCSLEDCWNTPGVTEVIKVAPKSVIKNSNRKTRARDKPVKRTSNSAVVDLKKVEKIPEEVDQISSIDQDPEDELDEAVPPVVVVTAIEDPPESACPSETEGEDEDEDGGDSSTFPLPPKTCEDSKQVVDRWKCSSVEDTVNPKGVSVVRSPMETSTNSCDSIDEIVNDHDNFGTDENEDSLDASSSPVIEVSMGTVKVSDHGDNDDDNASIIADDAFDQYPAHQVSSLPPLLAPSLDGGLPLKRKSETLDEDRDGQDEMTFSGVKKQCTIAPDETIEIVTEAMVDDAGVMDEDSPGENDRQMESPPQEMLNWLGTFSKWSNGDKLWAIDQLIAECQPCQVRHMLQVIEPQLQRDFISLLPKELALYVLSFLSPRDLLRAAQTCRCWRILCEDNLLWREKCREAGLEDFRESSNRVQRHLRKSSNLHSFHYSTWKASYMREHNIEMNWRMRDVKPVKVLKGHDDHVITCLQFSNNRIVSGSDDNTLKVWSASSGKCLRNLVGHTGGVWSSQMEGTTIVSGSTDRTLKVWDSETGECLHTLYGHTSTVRCMHLHKDRVVSGSRDATLRMWNIVTGQCLHVLMGHMAAVRCVQYDGRLVVSGAYDYMVKVWNPETEECLHTLSGHTNRVYSLQFDGVHVVSGSLDTSIRVWDVESGTCKHALMGHQSLTSGMELRNNILVSGNADSTVKVWDITTGQCLQTLSGPNKHQSAVTCLQFNSKFVITSSDDGTVKLWDVKTGDFIRDLVALDSGGSGGVVWRIRANHTKLVCAVGSRNGTEETKLMVLDFDSEK